MMTDKIRELVNELPNEIKSMTSWEELYRYLSSKLDDVSEIVHTKSIEAHAHEE